MIHIIKTSSSTWCGTQVEASDIDEEDEWLNLLEEPGGPGFYSEKSAHKADCSKCLEKYLQHQRDSNELQTQLAASQKETAEYAARIPKRGEHLPFEDDSDRQLVLLALATLSHRSPGMDDALNRIALRIDNIENERAVLYDGFRANGIPSEDEGILKDTDEVLAEAIRIIKALTETAVPNLKMTADAWKEACDFIAEMEAK